MTTGSKSPSQRDDLLQRVARLPGRGQARVKRFAAVDIGTNTILLLAAELGRGGTFRVLEDRAEITRLGAGVDRTRRIGPDGVGRSLEVLRDYVARCRKLGVDEIVAVGTSAIRDARNSGELKARLKAELGLDLRVLTGAEEAAYSYLAVEKGLALKAEDLLVVDVGGGSTELVWGRGGAIHRWASLDMGSVRLTERFLFSDPVREEECGQLIHAMDHELERSLAGWAAAGGSPAMVGIAGTFTTLAAIAKGLSRYSHSEVHGGNLSRAEIQRQIGLFKTKAIAGRNGIPGLEPKRADVILAGAMLIDRIMAHFRIARVTVSDQGIRYGLLYERLAG